jgi:hypothetical protein
VVFDEFNGSHGEQVDVSDVGDEDPSQDILAMCVSALLPMKQLPHEDIEGDSSTNMILLAALTQALYFKPINVCLHLFILAVCAIFPLKQN